MATLGEVLARAAQLHATGDLAAVEQLCLQILHVRPEQPDALHRLGLIACQRGRPDVGLTYLDRAMAYQPGNAALRVNRGLVSQNLGRHAEALADFREAVRLQPTLAEAHNQLGILLADRND